MNYLATILTSINGSAGISMGHGQTGMASAADVMSNFCRIFDNYWFAVLLAFIVVILFFIFSRNGIARLTKHLKFTALVIWIAGLVLYMYGFNEGGSENNSLVLFLRASLSSMEMFVSHSDLIEVNGSLHHKAAYMVPFAIVHFCAVLVSAVFIIRLLGLRFVSWVKLVSWRIFRPIIKDKPCFVFFGINGNGILLAKSIKRLFKRNCRIIFINMPDGGHKHEDARFTFSHFFHSSGEGAVKYAGDIEIMEALMFNAEKRVSDISANDSGNNDDSTVFDIFNRLGLSIPFIKTLDFLVNKFAARQKVEFFFLSENESDNISSVLALKSLDKNDSPELYKNFRCYCHARKNNINSALLRHGGLKDRIYLVDSSSLSVMQLMKNVKNHPVSFVEIDTERGVAKTDFTGMIIGFNETGCDAFRFLYEFGSFVCDDFGTENGKTIYVVDENMDGMKAAFLNVAPALKTKGTDVIDWWENISTHSTVFWEKLQLIIERLNYVVIAVGDDEVGLSLAAELYEFAYRYRKDLKLFKIFVRLKDVKKSDYLRNVSEFIVPFGADRDIFEYETLSADVLEKHAIRFYHNYEKNYIRNLKEVDIPRYNEELAALRVRDDKAPESGKRIETVESALGGCMAEIAKFEEIENVSGMSADDKGRALWLHRRVYKLENSKYIKRNTKEDDIDVMYKEEQDKSNVWHVLTKRALSTHSDFHEIISDSVLLMNLNYCEHLRWNAKMELLGFIPGVKKCYRKRIHPCIVDCETLADKFGYTIPFDQAVVELSFSDVANNEKQQN